MWTCPKCQSNMPATMDVCWSCGASPGGRVDPNLVRAVDDAPIAAPPAKAPFATSALDGKTVRRRSRRRRGDELWGAMLLGGYLAVKPCVFLAFLGFGLIWWLTRWEPAALVAGTGFGITAWGCFMIWLYHARRNAALLRR
jgi:hypothetical protein